MASVPDISQPCSKLGGHDTTAAPVARQ